MDISFPDYFKDAKAQDFILQLLSKKPEDRLQGNFEILKNHLFFEGI